ncbi:MAG: hypothetical protein ACO3Q3_05430, partial [Flavobacteriaceae bacterium]
MRKRLFLGLRILLALLVVLFLLTLLASTPKVQNLIAQRLINNLSGRYGLTLSVDAVRVNPLSLNATIQHLFIPDHKGDTLLYVRSLSSRWGSLSAFMGNSSSFQYSLGETYLKVQTHEGDTLSTLAYYLNQLPKGRGGRFEAKSIRAGSVHIDYSDQFEGDAHEFLLRDITLTNLVASNNHIAGRLQFEGVYLKNETVVEPSLRADVTVDTQGSTLMVSELNLRTETDAIALSYLTYNRDSKRLEAVIKESFLSGKRLESMGVKGFGNRALYLEGSLSGDSDKLFTDKLSVQWGNSSGTVEGSIGLNKPSLSYEIQFSDIQAQWADLSWLTKTLNSQSSFQPLLSPRTAVKGSLSLSRKPDELLASSSLVIGDSRLEVSFNRVDQQESLQLDIRSFPINWLLKGATQRLSASLEANRKKGYPFEFNANIHRIDFDHGLSLERIIWEALPTGAAYSMAISSEVPGQSFEALFDYEKVKDRYSIEGKVDVNRLNALMSTPDFEALPFSTVASFSLWGSSLSDIQGQLNLDALRFFPPNRSLVEVGSVRMSHTALGQSERQFIVVSEDFVNLQVSGNYHLFDWQQAFSQLKLPRTLQLDADIQTGDRWVELIEGSTVLPEVSGYLRYTDGKLKSDIRLSQFSYDVFDMRQLRAYSNPSGGFVLDAESLLSPYFSLASVHTTIKGNRLELEASTTGAKSDRFLVNSSWNRLSDDQLLIAIDPSRFTLKQYQWVIEKRAEFMIDFNNRSVSLDRLDLKTLDNGYLSIYGGYNGNDNYAISLELENAPIETITPEIKNLSLKGNATGLLQFKKQGKRYEPRFNLSVEDLLVNNKFVGFFNGVVLGSANADIFTLQAAVLNSGRATLELSGILNQTENGL